MRFKILPYPSLHPHLSALLFSSIPLNSPFCFGCISHLLSILRRACDIETFLSFCSTLSPLLPHILFCVCEYCQARRKEDILKRSKKDEEARRRKEKRQCERRNERCVEGRMCSGTSAVMKSSCGECGNISPATGNTISQHYDFRQEKKVNMRFIKMHFNKRKWGRLRFPYT